MTMTLTIHMVIMSFILMKVAHFDIFPIMK